MLKVLTLLEGQVGETFDGVVTGVTGFGLFVQHPRYLVDGLLRAGYYDAAIGQEMNLASEHETSILELATMINQMVENDGGEGRWGSVARAARGAIYALDHGDFPEWWWERRDPD